MTLPLQLCPNGGRTQAPALPLTAAACAEDGRRCAELGALSSHFHPRDAAGRESLAGPQVGAWVAAHRDRVPGLPIGISTGAWILPGPQLAAEIGGWDSRPDFASVNFHEPDAYAVADALLAAGIGIEAGLWHVAGTRRFLDYPDRARCDRVLLELPDLPAEEALEVLSAIERTAGAALEQVDVLLHGDGRSVWPALDTALERGWLSRIGLEDTVLLPDGRPRRTMSPCSRPRLRGVCKGPDYKALPLCRSKRCRRSMSRVTVVG